MTAAARSSNSGSTETVYRACPLCEATCGVAVTVEGGRVASVRGDPDDPFSRGYICPKAHGLIGLQEDPDRLRAPVRREGGRFVEISWDDAFEEVGTRLREVRDAHGGSSLGCGTGISTRLRGTSGSTSRIATGLTETPWPRHAF